MKTLRAAAALIALATIAASSAAPARPRFAPAGRPNAVVFRPAPGFHQRATRRAFYPAEAAIGAIAVVGAIAAIAAIASEPASSLVCRHYFTWDGRPFDRCVPMIYPGY